MAKIKYMSENLANKIQAGEVVERISSVVKELSENSIDAASKSITINLENGGLTKIEVIDDGIGMDEEDASLCFGRHATSKLIREDDLFFINTLGFRGEALPSIASVSEVTLLTSTGKVGTELHLKGGKVLSKKSAPAYQGTKITVTNLFYNTPARLKYLKSEQAELNHTISLVERLALSHPDIKFTLTNNAKVIVKTSGSNDLKKTIHEIYGLQVSSKLIEIKGSNDDYDVYGYICKPEILKSNRNHMITIVNDRVVKNMDLNRAINDAYYTYKPDIKYPIVVLKIDTDPTLIDVNIHPTKQDIKLSKVDELYNLIVGLIKDALYQNLLIPVMNIKPQSEIENENIVNNFIQEEESIYNAKDNDNIQTTLDLSYKETKPAIITPNEKIKNLVLYPVGLALGTYIIAENEDGIYLIDQHAAQERINYEKYLNALKNEKVSTTKLLIPITIELSSSEFNKIQENMNLLTKMGFTLEEFGINTYLVKEHPTWLKVGYEEEQIRKIIDLVIAKEADFDYIKFNEHIAITLACKMSIKANMHISYEAMEELLQELVNTSNPYNCPHGRPTIIHFTKYDLEKMFKRVMN